MGFFLKAPLVSKNALNGIIYKIKNELKLDPIIENIIIPSSVNDIEGTCATLIYWNESLFDAGNHTKYANPWFQLSFPQSYIFPTAFSMRGVSGGYYFPFSWEVLGIPEDEENDENKWDLLATNNFEESTYCTTKGSSGASCDDPTNVCII